MRAASHRRPSRFPARRSAETGAASPPTAKPAPPPGVTSPDSRGRDGGTGARPNGSSAFRCIRGAQFIASYDAGRGQRYYLFGTNATFAEIVNYYKTALKQRGELVYDEPPVHEFDVGRYREETMAFPPGVTVKDYTWGGVAGLPEPEARRRARALQDDHHDRAGGRRRRPWTTPAPSTAELSALSLR